MKKTLIWAACFAALAFTSCHKDPTPTPTPTPEPQTVTRLASWENHNATNVLAMDIFATYKWEKGTLMHECDSIVIPVMTTVSHLKMYYEGGNLVKKAEENGSWYNAFTYENGRIKTFLDVHDGDSVSWGEVTVYNVDGNVEEFFTYDKFGLKTKWNLTWADGDVVKEVKEILAPEDMIETVTTTYTYDNKPNAYTGFPLGSNIVDGGYRVASRMSKHNMISEGYTYNYNEKGFLTSIVAEKDSTFFNYIEQTLE